MRDTGNNIAGFTYDYFIKGHLGNVKIALTEEEKQDPHPPASMETAQLQDNNGIPLAVTGFLNNQLAPEDTKPNVYLKWVLLDEQFKFVQSSSGAEEVGDDHELKIHTQTDFPITKNGYLYVFVSNGLRSNQRCETEPERRLSNGCSNISVI